MYGSGGIAPSFLTSALDGGQWSASHPGRFTPGEGAPAIHCVGDWMGPEPGWTLWTRERSLTPAGNKTLAVQPVAHRYTDRTRSGY
jgi:hypothetical protein